MKSFNHCTALSFLTELEESSLYDAEIPSTVISQRFVTDFDDLGRIQSFRGRLLDENIAG